MIDPNTVPLEADLSRADVRVLLSFVEGLDMVEFGCGGSSLLFAQVCAKLIVFESDMTWLRHIRKIMTERKDKTHYCPTSFRHVPGGFLPLKPPKADVYFIDGKVEHRGRWIKEVIHRRLAPVVIIHDSRLRRVMEQFQSLFTWPTLAQIYTIEPHYDDSNCIVVTLRNEGPVKYENWNRTETHNRLPHLKP